MTPRRWLLLAFLAFWAVAVFMGFFRFVTLEPTDFGFTRGMNKLEAFLGWQFAAMVVAAPIWALGRGEPSTALRWLSRLPLAWLLLLLAALIAIIGWSWAQHVLHPPQPYTPPGNVTAPAD